MLLALTAVVTYVPHIKNGGWYLDDWAFVASLSQGAERDGVAGVLSAADAETYRPGVVVVTSLLFAIGGEGQAAYLVVSALLAALEGFLLWLVLRRIGVQPSLSVLTAVLLVVLPVIDSTRLWSAATSSTISVCLMLLGAIFALKGLEGPSRRSQIAWHSAATAAFLASVLTYELVAPLICCMAAIYLFAGPRTGILVRWAADLAAVTVGVLLLVDGGRQRGTKTDLDSLWLRSEQILDNAVEVFRFMLPGGSLLAGSLGVAVLIALAFGVGRAATLEGQAVRQWSLLGGSGALAALLGFVMLLPADPYYIPRIEGIGNRTGVVAALGGVVLLVSVVALSVYGAAALMRLCRWAPLAAAALIVATALQFISIEWSNQRAWADSWVASQRVVAAVSGTLGPSPPRGLRVVTFRHQRVLLPADVPVFDFPWDLRGAVRWRLGDETADANAWAPQDRCDPEGVAILGGGEVAKVMPYGQLYFVDVGGYRGYRVANRAECLRMVGRLTAE
ncbi:MAG: hypothetical protein WKF94_11685 [Solirubrobacteraceae bacterium]